MYEGGGRGRSPLEIAARLPTVCLLRAFRLRPCKRVTRSINPLGAARAVNNVATVVSLRSVAIPASNSCPV